MRSRKKDLSLNLCTQDASCLYQPEQHFLKWHPVSTNEALSWVQNLQQNSYHHLCTAHKSPAQRLQFTICYFPLKLCHYAEITNINKNELFQREKAKFSSSAIREFVEGREVSFQPLLSIHVLTFGWRWCWKLQKLSRLKETECRSIPFPMTKLPFTVTL